MIKIVVFCLKWKKSYYLNMRVLIATGIYPPQIGGPAQYAKNLKEALEKETHSVRISVFSHGRGLPAGVRHLLFFFKAFSAFFFTDFCIALDTFSVGFPAVLAAKIFGKKIIIRTGGDFLWESYVERTGDLVIFREFYGTRKKRFSLKERIIFLLTRWTLQNSSSVVFSTIWQKDIFEEAYKLDSKRIFIIENYYGKKIESENPKRKNFLAFTRPLKWKNLGRLESAFRKAKEVVPELVLDQDTVLYEESIQKMKQCYAVVLVSLGDISPNMILDALRCNKPFILTKETGLYEKFKEVALFVDPEDEEDIKEKILLLSDNKNYELYKKKVEEFTFTHSWEDIANEFFNIYGKI